MASIIVDIEKGIEIGATDVLKLFTRAETKVNEVEPAAIAGLAVVIEKLNPVLGDAATLAANPAEVVNVPFDAQTVHDLIAVWPAVLNLAKAFQIKV